MRNYVSCFVQALSFQFSGDVVEEARQGQAVSNLI